MCAAVQDWLFAHGCVNWEEYRERQQWERMWQGLLDDSAMSEWLGPECRAIVQDALASMWEPCS